MPPGVRSNCLDIYTPVHRCNAIMHVFFLLTKRRTRNDSGSGRKLWLPPRWHNWTTHRVLRGLNRQTHNDAHAGHAVCLNVSQRDNCRTHGPIRILSLLIRVCCYFRCRIQLACLWEIYLTFLTVEISTTLELKSNRVRWVLKQSQKMFRKHRTKIWSAFSVVTARRWAEGGSLVSAGSPTCLFTRQPGGHGQVWKLAEPYADTKPLPLSPPWWAGRWWAAMSGAMMSFLLLLWATSNSMMGWQYVLTIQCNTLASL